MSERGCFDVCPSHCGVCQAPLGSAHLRLLAEHLRNFARTEQADEGRIAYELGLAPCCAALALGRRSEQESLRRFLAWSGAETFAPGDELRERTEALPDRLLYAGVLRDLGATLDRAYLDGLHGKESSSNVELGAVRAELTAELLPATTQAERLPNGSTMVRVQFRTSCTIQREVRVVRVACHVPAPLGGYITTVDKQRGNVMHVALRTALVPHEIEARAEGPLKSSARMLTEGPQGPVHWHLELRWRDEKELRAATVSLPAAAKHGYECRVTGRRSDRAQVPVEILLRALFGVGTEPLCPEDVRNIKTLFLECCRRRTGCAVDGGGVLRHDARFAECLFDDRVMNGHCGFAADDSLLEAASAHLRRAGVETESLGPAARSRQFREIAWLVWGTCSPDDAGAADFLPSRDSARAAALLDQVVRLYLHAIRVHMDPQGEPAEQARSVTWPGAVAREVARRALRSLLQHATRSLRDHIARARPACPPRSLGLVMQGAPPPAARGAIALQWLPDEATCPACGRAAPSHATCSRCEAESRAELARTPLRGPARTARNASPIRLARSSVESEHSCWWNASVDAAAARCAYRHGQWTSARRGAALVLRRAARFTVRSLVRTTPKRPGALRALLARIGYLPVAEKRVLQRLSGSRRTPRARRQHVLAARILARESHLRLQLVCTAGARAIAEAGSLLLAATVHRELRGSGERPPCLAVADPEEGGPHAASVVCTGIVNSQVDSAHGRRRPCAELEGVRDSGYNHEKTTEQRRVLCVGTHWSPRLDDDEDMRTLCECAALALQDLGQPATGTSRAIADFARLRLGQSSLLEACARFRAQRSSFLRCRGDESLLHADHERLSVLQALDFNRALQRRLRERLLDWRVGETAYRAETRSRVQVCGAQLSLRSGPRTAEPYVVGRRLPRRGDMLWCNGRWEALEESPRLLLATGECVDPASLQKLAPRDDPGKLPALAYVNAILNEREGTVDIRTQGGFVCVPVQLAAVPHGRRAEWANFLEDVSLGRVGMWHVSALALEEEVGSEKELLTGALGEEEGPPSAMRFRYLLGEAALRGARACSMSAALGHIVRLAAQLRSLGSCAREPPAVGVEPWGALAAGPCMDGGLAISPGALSAPGAAPAMLCNVAFVDNLSNKTWEDAGVTDVDFLATLGRCFHSVTTYVPRCSTRLLTRAEVAALPRVDEEAIRRLDRDGRARGPLRQGDPLGFAADGSPLPCPFDAIVEHWGQSLRGLPSVTLVVTEAWASGMKVVWSLQKSVLTSVEDMIVAPQSISYVRSELSCVGRNAPSTWLYSRMLELCHARGFAAHRSSCARRLPGHAEFLGGTATASAEQVRAARQLCPGINSTALYPVVHRLSGRAAGRAFIGPQEQGISLKNSATQKMTMHLGPGSRARRGHMQSRGQRGERMEQALTRCAGAFGPNRPPGAKRAFAPPEQVEARARILAQFGAAMTMQPEDDDVGTQESDETASSRA